MKFFLATVLWISSNYVNAENKMAEQSLKPSIYEIRAVTFAGEPDLDPKGVLMKEKIVEERRKTEPLYLQEKIEITAVKNDKNKSQAEKRTSIWKIREKYLNQRNEVRRRIREELRLQIQKASDN